MPPRLSEAGSKFGEPSELQLARIERQLLSRRRRGSLPYIRLRLAFAALFLITGGASVEAARAWVGWTVSCRPCRQPRLARCNPNHRPG